MKKNDENPDGCCPESDFDHPRLADESRDNDLSLYGQVIGWSIMAFVGIVFVTVFASWLGFI